MPQLNVYVPERLEKKIRKEAKLSRKSVSAYVADLMKDRMDRGHWRPDFFTKIVGGWKGDFPEIERPAPEEREDL